MDLMVVVDAMPIRPNMTMLTGPLCLKDIILRSDVERAFGEEVVIESVNGQLVRVSVKSVAVSQALSGAYQVSVAVELPGGIDGVALDTLVKSER